MKEKILELIHKELKNVTGENIFKDTSNIESWHCSTPYQELNLAVKINCDASEYINPEVLGFSLKFEDGEPNIIIWHERDYTSNLTLYKTKYFGFSKFWQNNITYTITTKVNCGHISFDLSDDETAELLKLTKESYAKYLSLKDELKDKKVLDKLNLRLEKYNKG